MGKNQLFKAVQRAKHVAALDGSMLETEDGTVDASFHTPEWHAARMSLLQHRRMSWDEYKMKTKEEEVAKSMLRDEDERVTREYRAQLKADRERRLGKEKDESKKKRSRKEKERRHKKREKKGVEKSKRKTSKQRSTSMNLSPVPPVRLPGVSNSRGDIKDPIENRSSKGRD